MTRFLEEKKPVLPAFFMLIKTLVIILKHFVLWYSCLLYSI